MNIAIELKLHPEQYLEPIACGPADRRKRWLASSNDPYFRCDWDGPQKIPGGWYVFESDLEVHEGNLRNPCFYPSYDIAPPLEDHSVPIMVDRTSKGCIPAEGAVVRFVGEVRQLRFDPTTAPCDFSLSNARLKRIGKLEAARRLISGVLAGSPGSFAKARVWGRVLTNLLTRGPRVMADRLYHEYAALARPADISDYSLWLDIYDEVDELRLSIARSELDKLARKPKISVIVPVYNTPEKWLRRCIDSVRAQVYDEWELCVADDASTQPHVIRVLQQYANLDPRIRYVRRGENGHISAASNSAIELATGEYLALLDHDDELHPLALLECAKAFSRNPQWRMLFTDEDKIDEAGKRSDPYFKSDWNPDLLLAQNCVCHLGVYERDLIETIGRFRPGVDGAQDWDLTLRVSERLKPSQIGHVPKVLYHWRMIKGSTAMGPGEKSYAHFAAMRVIQDHLDRIGTAARVQELPGFSGYYRVVYDVPSPAPLVSLLIPTRDRVDLLKQCIDSILDKTTYPNYEIIVIDNDSCEQETLDYLAGLDGHPRVRVVEYPKPFNYSAINNYGATFARGEVIGLLNNDVQVIDGGWLTEMAAQALRPEIGVVGAMLYYPNDTIQHAGVVLGVASTVAGHTYVGRPRGYGGDKHRAA
ncbi:MAG TPA: glycosyltransferase, partial [Lysobacter sp.]|nr:glycosyltransferase [Lysobacter sp.]